MRFKVLEGQHIEGGHWTSDGKRVKGKVYKRGDEVVTNDDLSRFNHGTRRPKFERLPDIQEAAEQGFHRGNTATLPEQKTQAVVQAKPQPKLNFSALEAMNVKQLQDHAAAEEIELGQAKTKEEILKVIKAAS